MLYSHRSNFLHTLVTLQADVMGLSARDIVLAGGADVPRQRLGPGLLLPGGRLQAGDAGRRSWTAPRCYELLETEGVTFSAAVPTVWQMLLQHLRADRREA